MPLTLDTLWRVTLRFFVAPILISCTLNLGGAVAYGQDATESQIWRLEEEELPQLNRDGIGFTSRDGGLPGVYWGGKKRDELQRLLSQLNLRQLTPSIHRLVLRLLQSSGATDTSVSGDDILEARLDAAIRGGEGEAILAVLQSIPRPQYSMMLWNAFFNAQVLTRPFSEVCESGGQLSYSYANNPAAFITILACLARQVDIKDRNLLVAEVVGEPMMVDDFSNVGEWRRYLRIKTVIEAWLNDEVPTEKPLSPIECLLLYHLYTTDVDKHGESGGANLLTHKTTAGLRRTYLRQDGSSTEVPFAFIDLLLSESWISMDQYKDMARVHPDASQWTEILDKSTVDPDVAAQVRAVWKEKKSHVAYRRWLESLISEGIDKVWTLDPKAVYLLSDRESIIEALQTLPADSEVIEKRLHVLLGLSEKQYEQWSTGVDILDAGGRGQLNWSQIGAFSIANPGEILFPPDQLRDLYEAIARRDVAYVMLFVAGRTSWNDLAEASESLIAICAHALHALGFEKEALDLVKDYLIVTWIMS